METIQFWENRWEHVCLVHKNIKKTAAPDHSSQIDRTFFGDASQESEMAQAVTNHGRKKTPFTSGYLRGIRFLQVLMAQLTTLLLETAGFLLTSTGWWLTYPSEKYEIISQIGSSQLLGKIKHVPNHQPEELSLKFWPSDFIISLSKWPCCWGGGSSSACLGESDSVLNWNVHGSYTW